MRVQAAAYKGNANIVGFVIGEGEERLRGLSVDELDAEDFGGREGSCYADIELGGLGGLVDG